MNQPPQRYRIESMIGRGGQAVVYRAEDTRLHRPVALKIIDSAPQDATELARIVREARTAGSIRHPNVIKIFDVAVHGSQAYLAMELLEGETLAACLSRGPLPVLPVIELLRKLLSALEAVHAADVLHRDLKPSNVFLRRDSEPVLLDFGLASCANAQHLTAAGTVMGTHAYLAPECLAGRAHSSASDLFGLAMLGLEALGCRIFPEEEPAARVLCALSSGSYYQDASRALARFGRLGQVLLRALSPHPDDRFASAGEMAQALVKATPEASGAPAAEMGETVQLPRARRPRRRRRRWMRYGAIALLLPALVVAGMMYRRTAPVMLPSAAPSPSRWVRTLAQHDAEAMQSLQVRFEALAKQVRPDALILGHFVHDPVAAFALISQQTGVVRAALHRLRSANGPCWLQAWTMVNSVRDNSLRIPDAQWPTGWSNRVAVFFETLPVPEQADPCRIWFNAAARALAAAWRSPDTGRYLAFAEVLATFPSGTDQPARLLELRIAWLAVSEYDRVARRRGVPLWSIPGALEAARRHLQLMDQLQAVSPRTPDPGLIASNSVVALFRSPRASAADRALARRLAGSMILLAEQSGPKKLEPELRQLREVMGAR